MLEKQPWLNNDRTPQEKGFMGFFTSRGFDQTLEANAMAFATAVGNRNRNMSTDLAMDVIDDAYFPGPMHFADQAMSKVKQGSFIDFDIEAAYPTWLIAYKNDALSYKVGGTKVYYNRVKQQTSDKEIVAYKIEFAYQTDDYLTSRVYRHWIVKGGTHKIITTKNYVTGHILIPNIKDLVNRFLREIRGYKEHSVKIIGTVITVFDNNVYINSANIKSAIRQKDRDPMWKQMLNASTGYLARMDKLMYFTMVNHVRYIILRAEELIREYEDLVKMKVVAANTDGVTIWTEELDLSLYYLNQLSQLLYKETGFKIRVKEFYDVNEAHVTPADIRRRDE